MSYFISQAGFMPMFPSMGFESGLPGVCLSRSGNWLTDNQQNRIHAISTFEAYFYVAQFYSLWASYIWPKQAFQLRSIIWISMQCCLFHIHYIHSNTVYCVIGGPKPDLCFCSYACTLCTALMVSLPFIILYFYMYILFILPCPSPYGQLSYVSSIATKERFFCLKENKKTKN